MSLYIVIPAYNEEQNIVRCVEDWYPIVQRHNEEGESRLVIIDDGSRDHTWEKLEEMAASRPLLLPVQKQNGGHGSAVLHGYRFAVAQGASWVFQTDSDGQTNPDEFEAFWERRNEFDAILGFRPNRGDGFSRKLVEKVVCLLLRIIFGIRVKDANAPFRLMNAELLQKYIDRLPRDFNLPNIMFTTYFVYFQERVLFLPISFQPRKAGNNSINLKKIFRIGWKALGDFVLLRKRMNS